MTTGGTTTIYREKRGYSSSFGRLFTVLLCLSPLLCIYKSGIPGIMLGEFVLLLMYLYELLFLRARSGRCVSYVRYLLLIFVYFILTILLSLLYEYNGESVLDILMRIVRYTFYLFIIFDLSVYYFNGETAYKAVSVIAIITSGYAVLQYLYHRFTGNVLPGFIGELLYHPNYATRAASGSRCRSLFYEPAHFSEFLIICLTFLVFYARKKKYAVISIILGMAGILLSASGTGYIGIVLIIAMLLFAKRRNINPATKVIIVLILAAVTAYLFFNTDYISYTFTRLSESRATEYRTEAYLVVLRQFSANPFYIFTGCGYGNTASAEQLFTIFKWFPSIAYFMYCTGIIGFGIFVAVFIKIFGVSRKHGCVQSLIMLLYAGFVTEMIHDYNLMLALSLALVDVREITVKFPKDGGEENSAALEQAPLKRNGTF